MWISKAWKRPLRMTELAAMGAISFWSLVIYLCFRIGDMVVRGQLGSAFTGRLGLLFTVEIVFGGLLPLLLLARPSQRANPRLLFLGTLLVTLGVSFNRVNVVLFAMNLKGAMPQVAPATYSPSLVEWGISVGLIAATIFLFGLGVRLLPILPKYGSAHGD
jgi:formate dehydrogenase iron-sulfur subunit